MNGHGMRWLVAPAAIATLGAGLVAVIAWRANVSADEALDVAAIGAGSALVVGTGGMFALRVLQRRSLAAQVAATTLVVLVSVGVGAWIAAEAMFLSAHDLSTLAVILVAAGTIGVIAGLVVGRRIGRASGALIEMAHQLGAREQVEARPTEPVPEELQSLYDALVDAARELADTRAREQALDQSRRELIAWVSHDLRTPLAAIRAVAEALEDGVVDDSETDLALSPRRTGGNGTLGEPRRRPFRAQPSPSRRPPARARPGAPRRPGLRCARGAGAVAAAKGVRLEGQLLAASPEVAASPPELLRALRNVLENAIRHTPSDGTVIIELVSRPSRLHRVRDTAAESQRTTCRGCSTSPSAAPSSQPRVEPGSDLRLHANLWRRIAARSRCGKRMAARASRCISPWQATTTDAHPRNPWCAAGRRFARRGQLSPRIGPWSLRLAII